jgi:predicted ATPase
MTKQGPPYPAGLRVVPERMPSDAGDYPYSIPFVRTLDLTISSAVTVFVGENGSGKSTLLEAVAALSRLAVSGGARADLGAAHAPQERNALADVIRPSFRRRPRDGYFLRAEPEAALSPQRQLVLLAQMHALVEAGNAQFLIATHSPILMTYPDADLVSFDDPALPRVALEQTSHFEITKGVLDNPARYWKHLKNRDPV